MKLIKNIAPLLLVLFFAVAAYAQTPAAQKEQRKQEKALKKQKRAEELEANQQRILSMVEGKSFVIEATSIVDRFQNRFEVSPNINFIKIDGEEGVVQYGFNHRVGYNGLGGLTLEGKLTGYKVVTNSKGSVTIHTNITSTGLVGPATVTVNILNDGTARATVIGSFGSKLTFNGDVQELEESYVYQGIPLL